MTPQNYQNHAKYYIPHHFIFYPISLALIIYAVYKGFHDPANHFEWMTIAAAVLLIAWLSFMTRQHYSLTSQDRIIRLELRFRYYLITHKRFDLLEPKLSFPQIAALRFASDEELPALVDRAIAEQMSAREIKKSIRKWEPDHMRV